MHGEKRYYKIPVLTKLFEIKFYIYWKDDKFYKLGFKKDIKMSLEEALNRLENKRIRREIYD